MDCNRLPLLHDSDILYMYKHPNAIKHVQTIYDIDYTVNPRHIIKAVVPREKIMADKKKEIKDKSSVYSFIVEEPIEKENIEQHNTITSIAEINKADTIVTCEQNEESIKTEESVKAVEDVKVEKVLPIDAWRFMVSNIDDTSSLYTDNMWRDAIDSMKQKLIVLMTSGAGHKKYGPKKSRTILAWLTDNKRGTPASAETAIVIADFISWLIDVKISSVETTKINALWIMFRKRGMWMLKHNF